MPVAPALDGEPAVIVDDHGVDRSLIRWMLSLSPTERLRVAESAIALVASVKPAVRASVDPATGAAR